MDTIRNHLVNISSSIKAVLLSFVEIFCFFPFIPFHDADDAFKDKHDACLVASLTVCVH